MVKSCDYKVASGLMCNKPCKWLVVMPHNDDPKHACQTHLAPIISQSYEHYMLTTTDPSFTVRRW